jgi:cytochrome oxidase Cu insertion factor (SCO1/SenC/PrrC family)
MRGTWALVLLLAVLILAPSAVANARIDALLAGLQIVPLEPTRPPAFSGRDLTGAPITLAQFRGRPVLLYFWATW